MSLKKVGATTLSALLLAAGIAMPAMAQENTTPEQVRVIVKADLVGGGTLVDQTVDRDDAKTILQTIEQAKGSVGMKKATSWGSDYIVGFEGTATIANPAASYTVVDAQTVSPSGKALTAACKDNSTYFGANVQKPYAGYIMEKEYTGTSGWLIGVGEKADGSDKSQMIGTNYVTAGTSIGLLPDNAVITVDYSLNMGADVGYANASYLPTAVSTTLDGYGLNTFDWSAPSVYVAP